MRNIKLTIEYDGTDFCGYQVQPKKRTVMGEFVKALKKVTGETPKIEYSSRTDSGAHSFGQTASFVIKSKIPLSNIRRGLNMYLPEDIAVVSAEEVPRKFNARFDAKAKLYKYVICDSEVPPAINRKLIYHFRLGRLDLRKMRMASKYLIGKHDFSSFGVNDRVEYSSPVKKITEFKIEREGGIINIYVKGSGFLYKMVRSIVGTLIEVGRGKIKPEKVKDILEHRNRSNAGPTVPAHGLFLMKVYY